LGQRTWRYAELKRDLGRVTHKVLTEQLRELEGDGLLERAVHPEVPPRVEYSLSALGETALTAIEELRRWGRLYRERTPRPPKR
jgi:DNA-binding HxlR family transcriptional regulator